MRMKPRAIVGIFISFVLLVGITTAHADRAIVREQSASSGEQLGAALELLPASPSRAAKQLRELLDDAPSIKDVVLYYLGIALRDDDPAQARSTFESIAAGYPDSVVTPRARAALAELLLESGDSKALAELADKWTATRSSAAEGARVALAAARALASDSPVKAAAQALRARQLAPRSQSAKDAVDLLRRLRDAHAELRPTSAEQIHAEAKLTQREGNLGAQAELLDRFLKTYPNHRLALDATLARGRNMARLENRERAAAWLDDRAAATTSTAARARLLFAAAGNYWNAHASDKALERFEAVLALNAGAAERQRAHYAIARIHEAAFRYTAAATAYRTATKGSDPDLARESRWRAGWASYRAGNYDGAAWVFGRMAKNAAVNSHAKKVSGREEALYWQARSLERGGKRDQALEIFRGLLAEFPDGYYAYLAEKRSGMVAKLPVIESLKAVSDPLNPPLQRALERARMLEQARLGDLAMAELRKALAAAPPLERLRSLPRLLDLGAYTSALRTSLDLYRKDLLKENQLYPFIYPKAYADLVIPASKRQGLDPYLVFSLMRQESLFDQHVTSPAAAYGLMQLLPSTARRVAVKMGIDGIEADDLFRADINVKLGTAYLGELAERFDNDPVLMLAGYNAGENAAERWRQRLRGIDLDEFIERISYRETRNYVKKVLRNYRNYLRLYGEVAGGSTAEISD